MCSMQFRVAGIMQQSSHAGPVINFCVPLIWTGLTGCKCGLMTAGEGYIQEEPAGTSSMHPDTDGISQQGLASQPIELSLRDWADPATGSQAGPILQYDHASTVLMVLSQLHHRLADMQLHVLGLVQHLTAFHANCRRPVHSMLCLQMSGWHMATPQRPGNLLSSSIRSGSGSASCAPMRATAFSGCAARSATACAVAHCHLCSALQIRAQRCPAQGLQLMSAGRPSIQSSLRQTLVHSAVTWWTKQLLLATPC